MENIENGTEFYFTHSYEFIPEFTENILGMTFYDNKITSIIQNKNIFGVQFHPEKSQEPGLKLISNFSKI